MFPDDAPCHRANDVSRLASPGLLNFHLMIRFPILSLVALGAAMTSCSDSSTPKEITGIRELTGDEKKIRVVADDAERFRLSSLTGGGGQNQAAPAAPGASGGGELPFTWKAPDGWTLKPGMPMRDLSFTFGESGEGECYLSRLPGAGGGLTANVNRWRGQMGLPAITDAEVLALPKRVMFGLDATYVDITGAFSGMGGGAPKENYRMLGTIVASESGAVFVKMTGPAELIAANQPKFDAFCASLQPR
jgi:hypothetical protein